MLKKTKKPIRFSFFWSKKRKNRQRFHIFHQKTPNIQNFITKTIKKAPHSKKFACWCQKLSENSKSKSFYILTIWWWHKTTLSRVFLARNSPMRPMGPLCKPLKSWSSKELVKSWALMLASLVVFRPSLTNSLIWIETAVSRHSPNFWLSWTIAVISFWSIFLPRST